MSNELWIQHHRFLLDSRATFGALNVEAGDGREAVNLLLLEDPRQEQKIFGETCIGKGDYEVQLRTSGGMHDRYSKSLPLKGYGYEHRGMLWLRNVENFKWVYYHCGANVFHTEGCPLVGRHLNTASASLIDSYVAYVEFYSRIIAAMDAGKRVFTRITEGYPAPWEIG